jgi:hypothetical protein
MRDRAAGIVLAGALLAAMPKAADAGAWVQPAGRWQTITSFEVSRASAGFGTDGRVDVPLRFTKATFKAAAEYGWSERLTLFLAPEYVTGGQALLHQRPTRASDFGIEGGARYRLSERFGIFSLQGSFKFAGPFDLSNSARPDDAYIGEIRAEDGLGFRVFGADGFVDLEIAQRFIGRPRPNETVIDLAAGLWLGEGTLALVQCFNTVSGGDAGPPYAPYRMHKVEVSAVQHLWGRWFLQSGSYVSPAGQNSLAEQGLVTAVWARF